MSSRFSGYATTHEGVRDLNNPRPGNDPLEVNVGEGERTWSALGGGALMAAGMLKGGGLGLALLWSGAALLLRGVTGHCTVNAALGRNTA
jgi:uncharacterized membrane protein